MKHTILFFALGLIFTISKSQDKILENRINQFYKIEENKKLSSEEKINLLKEYIIPGSNSDSMAYFFYNSWNDLNNSVRKFKTKIVSIEYLENNTKAIVTTEDNVTYKNGEKVTYANNTIWFNLNEIWYRGDKKSELYKDGERLR